MAINTKGLIPRIWRIVRRVFIFLFIFHIFYLLLLKWVDPPITLTQLGSLLRGEGLKRTYVSMKNISPYAKLAVICSEDQLFPDHEGFDKKAIEKAIEHNEKSDHKRGASTISQQVAKNVFLWQGRDWFRKGLEVYFTFMIEWMWGKKRILEVYLNVIEMGKGVYGIEAAAHSDFNKSARSLTRTEAARIAAALPNPRVFTVRPLSNHVATRSAWIIGQMGVMQNDPDIQKLLQ